MQRDCERFGLSLAPVLNRLLVTAGVEAIAAWRDHNPSIANEEKACRRDDARTPKLQGFSMLLLFGSPSL